MSPCQVDNFICLYDLFDLTPIHNVTDRRGLYNIPTHTGGDILPTPPITPYTPLPPTYPPSPSYHFGGHIGGIMLLRKRTTKNSKKISGKIFGKKRSPI